MGGGGAGYKNMYSYSGIGGNLGQGLGSASQSEIYGVNSNNPDIKLKDLPKPSITHLNESSSRGNLNSNYPDAGLSSAMTTSKASSFPVEQFDVPVGSRNYESGTHGGAALQDPNGQNDNAFDGDRRRRAGGSHAPRHPVAN